MAKRKLICESDTEGTYISKQTRLFCGFVTVHMAQLHILIFLRTPAISTL